jgi:hypothetical protein
MGSKSTLKEVLTLLLTSGSFATSKGKLKVKVKTKA